MSTKGKKIHCKAAVLWKEGQPLTVEDITVDTPKDKEVRVKMVAAGICATDAHFIWGWNTDVKLDFGGNPVVLGHEGAGIVESVGPGVTSVVPGDKVILLYLPECGQCPLCANPNTNFCMGGNLQTTMYHDDGQTRMKINGKPLLALTGTSTFSEYSVVREIQVAKINSSADLKTCSIIGCAVGTGYGSVTNIAKVHQGSTCAIWGLGAIGLSAVLACKDAGAKNIIGIDINSDKEEIARKMGCTRFINPKTPGIGHIVYKGLTLFWSSDRLIEDVLQSEGGLDYAFDCIGNKAVLDSALKSLTPWGTLVVIGLGPPGNKIEVSVAELLMGKCLTGGYFGKYKPRAANQRLVDMHCSGVLPIDDLITHRVTLKDINKAFDRLKEGKTIRTIIEF